MGVAIPRKMQDTFDGVLELSRIVQGVREAIDSNQGDLFTETNKRWKTVLSKLEDAIFWAAELHCHIYGGSREVKIRDTAKKASNLPYNTRSSHTLLLTYLPLQSTLKSQINGLYELPGDPEVSGIVESLEFSLEKVEELIAKLDN